VQLRSGRPRLTGQSVLTGIGIGLMALVLFLALFPEAATSQSYAEQNLRQRLLPPAWDPKGAWEHPLGTDHLGRDLWARIVFGARVSMTIALGAVLIAGTLGVILGIVAGYHGGLLDEVLMRIADIQLAFSPILLIIALMAVIGKNLQNIILVLGVVSWVQYARVARGAALSIKRRGYIEAARAVGVPNGRLMLRHILPNMLRTLLVLAALNASQQILNESALSFLGLGVQPPTPAWGSMLNQGREYFQVAWWNAALPGLAILLSVLGINLIGDGLSERTTSL
jgi:peptide/nickel transport system permease protein